MCGICGYIHLDISKRPSEIVLKDMMATLARRGPDDEGLYLKDNVALGHRRLSIIDLETGHQPMFNEDNSIVIVYNGEIYNYMSLKERLTEKGHAFRTRSDAEVIIHAYEEYGEDCVKFLDGMFAFAIWDSRKEALFLARDRFGKKPLYYSIFENQFIFASELKAILKHPAAKKEIDMNSLSKYLAYEYIPSPLSIFKNIYKLEPASKITLKGGSLKRERYWDLDIEKPDIMDVKETESRLLDLLKESVRKRLVSDVPLGVFLSGGIDSSSVVAMMARLMPPKDIKTFSIGFSEGYFDESSDARLVADHFGTDHRQEILAPKDMLDVLPDIVDMLDEPLADSSIIPTYLVSRFTRRHVKVALGGDGGDELFLGYPSFMAHRFGRYFNGMPGMVRNILMNMLKIAALPSERYMNLNLKAMRFLRGLSFPEGVRQEVWRGSFTPQEEEKLFTPGAKIDYNPLKIYDITNKLFQSANRLKPLDRAMYIYIKTYMTDDILAKVDRASMANSLEVRAPFLDTEFAEYAAGIPNDLKLRGLSRKWVLKNALKGILPRETLNKPKQGFAVPIGRWLKADLKNLLFEKFSETKIKREGIFDHGYIRNLLNRYIAGRDDTAKEIWALFMFEMWYDRWMK